MNYPWLSCRCEKCFCTPPLRWSGEYLKPENGRRCSSLANQVAAKSPDFSKRVGCRAEEEEGEYSDELSWVVLRKTTFQTFWATIHQQRRVGDLQKVVQDEETAAMTCYHILTFWRDSQPVKGQEVMLLLTLSKRASLSQETIKYFWQLTQVFTPPLYLRGHWQQKQRGWLALLLVKRRPSQGKSVEIKVSSRTEGFTLPQKTSIQLGIHPRAG